MEGPRDEVHVNDDFSDEQLLVIGDTKTVPWFANYVNYLLAKVILPDFSYQQNKRFFSHLKHYYWEGPMLYKHCTDQVIRRCVPEYEMGSILTHCHTLSCRDTLEARGQQQRYYNQVSTSLACSRMCTGLYLPVISAKEWAAFPNGMNHPCAQF